MGLPLQRHGQYWILLVRASTHEWALRGWQYNFTVRSPHFAVLRVNKTQTQLLADTLMIDDISAMQMWHAEPELLELHRTELQVGPSCGITTIVSRPVWCKYVHYAQYARGTLAQKALLNTLQGQHHAASALQTMSHLCLADTTMAQNLGYGSWPKGSIFRSRLSTCLHI